MFEAFDHVPCMLLHKPIVVRCNNVLKRSYDILSA